MRGRIVMPLGDEASHPATERQPGQVVDVEQPGRLETVGPGAVRVDVRMDVDGTSQQPGRQCIVS